MGFRLKNPETAPFTIKVLDHLLFDPRVGVPTIVVGIFILASGPSAEATSLVLPTLSFISLTQGYSAADRRKSVKS